MPGRSKVLIIGAGAGLSAALARRLAARGHKVILAARNPSGLKALAAETGAITVACDASSETDMNRVFQTVDGVDGRLEIAIYNPSYRARGPIDTIDPADVRKALDVTAFGAFLMARLAVARMRGDASRGEPATLLFTGASAGVKGYAQSAPFAMGKFALRGLCQSLARELHPKGIHIGHVVVDGAIAQAGRPVDPERPDSQLQADRIAESYMHIVDQHRSAWAWEIELRPWTETF